LKICSKCGAAQPEDNFYRAKGTRDGLRGDCMRCFKARAAARYPEVREEAIRRAVEWRIQNPERYKENQRRLRETPEYKRYQREYHLNRKYGLTIGDYERMLADQFGGCAICGRPEPEDGSLHVDHDHETGAVRGLLCFPCNQAIGAFEEQLDLLTAALRYLRRHDQTEHELDELIRARVRALTSPAA
jgi:hypothetical protein